MVIFEWKILKTGTVTAKRVQFVHLPEVYQQLTSKALCNTVNKNSTLEVSTEAALIWEAITEVMQIPLILAQ